MNQSIRPSKTEIIKQKVVRFSISIGLSPQRLILSLILLIGVLVLICFLGFSNNSRSDAALTPKQLLEQQNEIDERLKTLFKQRITNINSFLLSMNQIQNAETEITDLESSHALTPSQKELVARIRLKNKGSALGQMLRNEFGYDAERADLLQFCGSYKDANELDIRNDCRYWLCAVPALEFAYHPSKETLSAFSVAIEEYEDCYLDSVDHAEQLAQILKPMVVKNRKTSELTSKGLQLIAQRMLKSENKDVRYIGEKLALLEVFGELDLKTLGYRIAWNNPSAADDMEAAIAALEKNIDISPLYVWDLIIRAYESHLSSDHVDKFQTTWQRMWTLSQQIQSEDIKKQVQTKLKLQEHRAASIGSTFDISGSRLDGRSIDFTRHDFIAVIFFSETIDSTEMLKEILKNRVKYPDLHIILAHKQSFSGDEVKTIRGSRSGYTIADFNTANKYYDELMVETAPYIILADSSGKILSTSLQFDQLKTQVARIRTNRPVSVKTKP